MKSSTLLLALSASASTALAAATPPCSPAPPSSSLTINTASYDGTCFYPTPDPNFPAISAYLGRWFQVAGTFAPFTAGCKCIVAEYSLNANGTIGVFNTCQRVADGGAIRITGLASPVDPAYFAAFETGEGVGAFQVSFPSIPGGGVQCPGPNYIVQKYDGEEGWAIVQSPGWETLFLLSRERRPAEEDVDAWIAEAGKLGTNVTEVFKISQEGCTVN